MSIIKFVAVACAAFALMLGPALAQKNIRLASAAQPGSVLLSFVDEMVDNINKNSQGALKVERLFVASEQEIISQVTRGRLEIGIASYTGASVVVPESALLNMPYVWRSDAERDYVTDNYALPVLKKLYEAKGMNIIGLGDVGWNDIFCKKACLTPADVRGMKVRIAPSASSKMFWQALQTNGVQMPLSELFPALQSNMVEGGDLPFLYYVTTPAAQSAPHYVLTRHLHQGASIIVSKRVWDGFSAAERTAISASVLDLTRMRKAVADSEKPKMQEFVQKGGFVHELTPAQRAEWAKLVEPHQDKLVAEIGGRSQELWDAIKKGKAEFAKKNPGS